MSAEIRQRADDLARAVEAAGVRPDPSGGGVARALAAYREACRGIMPFGTARPPARYLITREDLLELTNAYYNGELTESTTGLAERIIERLDGDTVEETTTEGK